MSKWDYFTEEEMMCKCGCGKVDMDEDFMSKLDAVRHECGFPLRVNSGYRCAEHNAMIGGYKNSQHLFGKAADISTYGMEEDEQIIFLRTAIEHGLFGIGVNEKGDHHGRFIHVDNYKPRLWSY